MNGRLIMGLRPQSIKAGFVELQKSRFIADRLLLGMLIGSIAVGVVALLSLLPVVHPGEQAPVRFSSLSVGYTLGVWYYPYTVALFGLAVAVVNSLLAYQAYGRNRLSSFLLLTGAGVVNIFCLVVSHALGAAR